MNTERQSRTWDSATISVVKNPYMDAKAMSSHIKSDALEFLERMGADMLPPWEFCRKVGTYVQLYTLQIRKVDDDFSFSDKHIFEEMAKRAAESQCIPKSSLVWSKDAQSESERCEHGSYLMHVVGPKPYRSRVLFFTPSGCLTVGSRDNEQNPDNAREFCMEVMFRHMRQFYKYGLARTCEPDVRAGRLFWE